MRSILLQIFIAANLTISSNGVCEFICHSDISYKWKKEKEEVANEVSFSALDVPGEDEESAKSLLAQQVSREKVKASDACKKEHENLAGCIATKYQSAASILQSLGFAARKAVQDAISSDCTTNQGKCTTISASEPTCKEKAKTEGEAHAAEGGAEKKDAKKAEKKK